MTEIVQRSDRRARALILWAFAAVFVALILTTTTFVVMTIENQRIEAEQQCRARISNRAAEIRDQQGSAVAGGLAASVIERQQIDTRGVAQRIVDLGQKLDEASGVRNRAIEICSANPDFIP